MKNSEPVVGIAFQTNFEGEAKQSSVEFNGYVEHVVHVLSFVLCLPMKFELLLTYFLEAVRKLSLEVQVVESILCTVLHRPCFSAVGPRGRRREHHVFLD